MKRNLILLLAFILLLSACSKPEESVLEQGLRMDDVELAEQYLHLSLQQDDEVFSLVPEDCGNWSPAPDGAGTPFDATASVLCAADGKGELEDIARMLTTRWLHVLMLPDGAQNTTFLITAYRNLQVAVYSEETLPEPYRQGIVLQEQADAGKAQTAIAGVWYVVPTVEYRYSGTVNGVADGDVWTSDLGGSYCLMLRFHHSEQSDLYSLSSAKAG